MEEKNNTPAQNTPKPWANPTPAGLVALAVACACFFGLLTGLLPASSMPIVGCWLLGGFVIQLIVALIDLKGGNLGGGNTFLYFSAFFMLVGGIEMMIKSYAPTTQILDPLTNELLKINTSADGFAWAILTLVVILWTPSFLKSPAILFIIVLFLDLAVPLIALRDFGILNAGVFEAFGYIAGISLLICGLLGVYLAAAMIINGTFGKNILPNPKPFYKEKK